MSTDTRITRVAEQLLAAYDGGHLVELPSAQPPGLTLTQAYAVSQRIAQLRQARGERAVGWKIGFTNRSIWSRYGVHAPVWAPVWSSTAALIEGDGAEAGNRSKLSELTLSLAGLSQPRLEPEIVFGFERAPRAGMSLHELQACIDWVAHGFEIVHTHYADWRFTPPDAVADLGLHGRLRIGPRVPVRGWATLAADLSALQVELLQGGVVKDQGRGAVVLDGPLHALKDWIDTMAVTTPWWQVAAGDWVTTGTITDAWPLLPGECWQTRLSEPRLSALTLRTEA
jgi:2-oxo-3-hexenedioate decarboxylase